MRGARIAEKIQEFYHTTGSSAIANSNTSSNNQILFNKTGVVDPKSRAGLMSQGGSRPTNGASKMLYSSETNGPPGTGGPS